jgi:hypothetical protein
LAAASGAIAAYVIGRGNPFAMLVAIILIAIAFRLYAYRLIQHRGEDRPPWWKWL